MSVSPTSVSREMRAGRRYPNNSTLYPRRQVVTVTGAGAWTAALDSTGNLDTACDGPCLAVTPGSGSGNGAVLIDWNGRSSERLAPGRYTGRVSIGGSNIDITLDVKQREPYLRVVYNEGYPVDCINVNTARYNYPEQCTVPNEYPTQTGFSIPAKGNSYYDPQFGSLVKRITTAAENCNTQYSTRTAISRNNTYLLCSDGAANTDIYRLSDAALAFNNEPGNINKTFWSASEDNVYYFFDGALIRKRTLGVATETVADYRGGSYSFTQLDDGGTADITGDGWLAFWDSGQTKVCAVDLNGVTTGNQNSKTFCTSYAAESLSRIDFVQIAKDDETGYRYVLSISDPRQVLWRVDGSALTKVGNFGEWPGRTDPDNDDDGNCEANETCFTTPHMVLGRDHRGRAIQLWEFDDVWSNTFLATAQVNKHAMALRPVEETGGGLRYLQDTHIASDSGSHFGCASNADGVCVASFYGNGSGRTSCVISAATSTAPVAAITATPHGWSTGQEVVIGSAAGNTCINGTWKITVTGVSSFLLNGSNCSAAGIYRANSGIAGDGAGNADSPNRQVVWLVQTSGTIKPLFQHRTKLYNTSNSDVYFATPRCSISRDGSLVVCNTNFGVPEPTSVVAVETRMTATEPPPVPSGPVRPRIDAGGIVNAASFERKLSPGARISVFGKDLSNCTQASEPPVRSLCLTELLVNSQPVLLYYVSPTQILAQLPANLPPDEAFEAIVRRDGENSSEPVTVPRTAIRSASPAIYSYRLSGETADRAIMLHADGTYNGPPAAPGSYRGVRPGEEVIIFVNGAGPTDPPLEEGAPAPNPPPPLVNPVAVYINDVEQRVTLAGPIPGQTGLCMVRFVIADNMERRPEGDYLWVNITEDSPRPLVNLADTVGGGT